MHRVSGGHTALALVRHVLSVIKHKHWRQLYCSDKRGYIQLHLTLVHTVLLLKVLKNERKSHRNLDIDI